jgi:hypothetical protein
MQERRIAKFMYLPNLQVGLSLVPSLHEKGGEALRLLGRLRKPPSPLMNRETGCMYFALPYRFIAWKLQWFAVLVCTMCNGAALHIGAKGLQGRSGDDEKISNRLSVRGLGDASGCRQIHLPIRRPSIPI